MDKIDILDKIADLHKQEITERSHYYIAKTLEECAKEIQNLRITILRFEGMIKEKNYKLARLRDVLGDLP